MHTLENEFLKVEISESGAELRRVYDKELKKERMWSGNPELWDRVSPVLFPIVGKVKDGYYLYKDESYKLPQHGFLRDQTFNLVSESKDSLVFNFTSTQELLEVYPFKHQVDIEYKLEGSSMKVLWTVKNLNDSSMHYSIGAHPGFLLGENKKYEFVFPNESKAEYFGLKAGLLDKPKLVSLASIDIEPEVFKDDAIIYGDVSSVILQTKDKSEFLRMNFKGFPFVGLWTVYNEKIKKVPFVCIEPWHGIVDEYTSDHDFTEKLGARQLQAHESETLEYEMIFSER